MTWDFWFSLAFDLIQLKTRASDQRTIFFLTELARFTLSTYNKHIILTHMCVLKWSLNVPVLTHTKKNGGGKADGLMGLDTHGRFPAIFYKSDILWLPVLFSCTPSPSWKWVYSQRKEFAPNGSKFFPLRVDPFSEGVQNKYLTKLPLKRGIP